MTPDTGGVLNVLFASSGAGNDKAFDRGTRSNNTDTPNGLIREQDQEWWALEQCIPTPLYEGEMMGDGQGKAERAFAEASMLCVHCILGFGASSR